MSKGNKKKVERGEIEDRNLCGCKYIDFVSMVCRLGNFTNEKGYYQTGNSQL
jgi:hypothetical protein